MEFENHLFLRGMRKLYTRFNRDNTKYDDNVLFDPNKVEDVIYSIINSDKPCMVGRFGANELSVVVNYLGIISKDKSWIKYIRNKIPQWWWNHKIVNQMEQCAGFFPSNADSLESFSRMMLEDMKQLDILGSWLNSEKYVSNYLNCIKVSLPLLEPFHSSIPWTRVLKDKDVVVIHPFADTIVKQYDRRTKIFNNQDVLPHFKSLRVIKAIQSIGGINNGYKDWFEALDYMKDELNSKPYDVALIGCGAYGFPLAAHAKRTGHKAVHLGGALQLLFGIIGKRWEDSLQATRWRLPSDSYIKLINEYWVRPTQSESPINANNVEGGCYW